MDKRRFVPHLGGSLNKAQHKRLKNKKEKLGIRYKGNLMQVMNKYLFVEKVTKPSLKHKDLNVKFIFRVLLPV